MKNRYSLLLVPLAACIGAVACALAQDSTPRRLPLGAIAKADPDTDFGAVTSYVATLLERQHYDKKEFDDEVGMPQRALEKLIQAVDPERMYLYEGEVAQFKAAYSTKLDDAVQSGDLRPIVEIFSLYKKRAQDRFKKIEKTLKEEKLDLNGTGSVAITREKAAWPKNEDEADALWVARLTADVLAQRLQNVLAEKRKAEKAEKAAKEPKEAKEEAPPAAEKPSDAPKETKPLRPELTPEEKVLKRYKRVMDAINDYDEEDVTNFALSAISQSYDPHSEYMSAPEEDRFRVEMNKQLIGIGAQLVMEDNIAVIDKLVAGAPAIKGGQLKVKDKVIGVAQGDDGEMEDVEGLKLDKVVQKIRGEIGSKVRLKVIPASDPSITKEITIVRDKVEMKENRAKAQIMEINGGEKKFRLGWIIIDSFYADMDKNTMSMTADVMVLLARLKKEGIDGLAVDLRGNGGGSLEEALKLTGIFVPRGPVVQVKSFDDRIFSKNTKNEGVTYDGPLLVMVDRLSASASEIFAAAIQDYGRGVVVGDQNTFGKGTVQTIVDVGQNMPAQSRSKRAGALKVTIQKFYRIAGGSTQLKGVSSDIVLPSRFEAVEVGEDKLEFPMAWDEINKARYESLPGPLPLEKLREASKLRIEKEPEFQYIREDVQRLKDQMEKNRLSLNEKERLAEVEQNRERTNQRKKAREARIAEENKNGDSITVWELNVDNHDKPLETVEKVKNSGKFLVGDDEDEDEAERETFLHDLDPTKREGMNVLTDLIDLMKRPQTAQSNNP